MRVAVFLGNSLAIHGIGTVFGRHKGRSRGYIRNQRHIGHSNFRSCGAARFDRNLDAFASGKLFIKAAVCGDCRSVHFNRTAVLLNGIIKRQCGFCGFVVFDSQCGVVAGVTTGSSDRDD